MTHVIPEEKIAEIRGAADIVDVVSGAVLLKKSGKNYLGLCPFHSEKTPSFTVSPSKQIFHCFGCGEGGNVFSFVMKQEGMTFPEAARTLAQRYNVIIPDRRMSPGEKRRLDERDQLAAVNQMGMDYYRRLLSDSSAGQMAREYLKKRGLDPATIESFAIGFAPEGWDNVLNYLVRKRIPPDLVEKSGLTVPRKNRSGYYDRFRNRIIFPIMDTGNRVLGFGGRVMDDSLPKYLNSPETPVYNKSRTLYGLNLAKPHCRETGTAIIVEGYFDVIALHQHGIRNAVATLGTALTPEHVRLLKGCIGEKGLVLLVYDSDEAGIKAARRSIEVFDKEFVNAQVLVLESGYDPDTYIFEFGAEAFERATDGALDIIPFLLHSAIGRHGLSVGGKVKIVAELIGALRSVSDVVARSLYAKMVSEKLGIDEAILLEKLRGTAESHGPAGGQRTSALKGNRESQVPDSTTSGVHGRLERQIIAMMLQVPDICTAVVELGALNVFNDQDLARIGQVILEVYDNTATRTERQFSRSPAETGPDAWVADILDALAEPKDQQLVADMAIRDEEWDMVGCEKQLLHFVETTRKNRVQEDIDSRIKEAVRYGDDDLVNQLLVEKQRLAVKREKRKMAFLNRR